MKPAVRMKREPFLGQNIYNQIHQRTYVATTPLIHKYKQF